MPYRSRQFISSFKEAKNRYERSRDINSGVEVERSFPLVRLYVTAIILHGLLRCRSEDIKAIWDVRRYSYTMVCAPLQGRLSISNRPPRNGDHVLRLLLVKAVGKGAHMQEKGTDNAAQKSWPELGGWADGIQVGVERVVAGDTSYRSAICNIG